MIYGTQDPMGKIQKVKVTVYRNGNDKTFDEIWTYNAYFNDRAEVTLDYAGNDPWHTPDNSYTIHIGDRVEFVSDEGEIADVKIRRSIDTSAAMLYLYDTLNRNYATRVKKSVR